MNSILPLILILVSPLNPLLLWKGEASDFRPDSAAAVSGMVKGTEREKEKESPFARTPEISAPQPVRIPGIPDLVLPNAHASLILDADSGEILHYNNGKDRRQIASLTKLMTAVLVMEHVGSLEEEMTVSQRAVLTDGTRVGCPRSGYCIGTRLKPGVKLRAEDLLKAMLMNSANDAAVVLAEHIGGTEAGFVELMNQKAKDLSLSDTHFCTASGLEIDGREGECYSSAYDIARIAAYALRYDKIWEIMRLPNNTEIYSADGSCSYNILNTDLVVNEIPQCIGGKTGFTPLAGRSLLVAAADKTEKHRVIAVLLDDIYRWADIKEMIGWTFRSHEWK